MLIGIAGKFCSGKTKICEILVEHFNDKATIINFADKVKYIAEDLFGMIQKDRTLLQQLGMKMREIRESVWVDYVIKQYDPSKILIVGDVRFEDEVRAINSKGGKVFYIDRNRDDRLRDYLKLYGIIPTLAQETHPSELLEPTVCNKVINNASLNQVFLEIINDLK